MSKQKKTSPSYLAIKSKIDDLEHQGILSVEPGYGYRVSEELSIFGRPAKGWRLCFHAGMGDGFQWIDEVGDELVGVCDLKGIETVQELDMIIKLFGQKG